LARQELKGEADKTIVALLENKVDNMLMFND